jgi:lysophospholipase L1-like esterase
MRAGGTFHEANWFDKHDSTVTALKTAKAEGKTIDAILIGDQVFDRFDDEGVAVNGSTDYWNTLLNAGSNPIPNTINLGFSGDTIADMQWRFDEILKLKDTEQLPTIKRVIVNAGGEDLARAGSTSTNEIGIGTAKGIGRKINALITSVKTGLPNAKVGSLTTVYRSDVNSNDYGNMTTEIFNHTTADAVYNSFTDFPNTYTGNFETDGVHLSTEGHLSLNFAMQSLMSIIPTYTAMLQRQSIPREPLFAPSILAASKPTARTNNAFAAQVAQLAIAARKDRETNPRSLIQPGQRRGRKRGYPLHDDGDPPGYRTDAPFGAGNRRRSGKPGHGHLTG